MYFNKYLLNNFYAPGSIVNAEEVLQTHKALAVTGFTFCWCKTQ